jgi:hypothetical protein
VEAINILGGKTSHGTYLFWKILVICKKQFTASTLLFLKGYSKDLAIKKVMIYWILLKFSN